LHWNRLWPVKTISCALFLAGSLLPGQTATTLKPAPSAAKTTSTSVAHKSSTRRKSHKATASSRKRGQQKIDPKRAQEIQQALIREHYLNGEPSSSWNDATQKAMQRYQADHGWQSKEVPDSRALIKLGLGPDHEHLLNPESAMTTQPDVRHAPAHASNPAVSDGPASADTQQK
jgi:hypothetical protein